MHHSGRMIKMDYIKDQIFRTRLLYVAIIFLAIALLALIILDCQSLGILSKISKGICQ